MKIIVTMQLPYVPALGGANKCNRMVAEALAKQAHDIQVIVPATNEANAGTLNHFRDQLATQAIPVDSKAGIDLFHFNGVEVHALHEQAQVRPHLIRQIEKFEPDWILVSGEEWSQGLLESALQVAPSRTIYLAHTVLFLPFGPQAFFPSERRTKLIATAAHIVSCGQFVHDYVLRWSGMESTIYHFPAYGSGAFQEFGCFDRGYVTLINPSLGKGLDIFLALARLLPAIQFACVPTWGTTKQDRARLTALANITMLKASENIDDIFSETRVLLLPSLWPEGFPLTSVEAMLRGIPVLGSNVGGVPEAKLGTDFVLPVRPIDTFTEELDDRLIPIPVIPEQTEEDIDQWYQALESLLSDRTFYEQQSLLARKTAQDFVSDLGIDPLENILNNLASQSPKNPSHSESNVEDQDLTRVEKKANNLSHQLERLTPEQQALLSQWLQTPSSPQQDEKEQRSLSFLDQASNLSASTSLVRETPQLPDPSVLIDPKWSEANEETLRKESPSKEPPLVSIARKNSLPLSFAQQRLWFLDQWEPTSPTYLLPYAWQITGPLDIQALKASFSQLVARHETLRTRFSLVKNQPVQVITKTDPMMVPLIDLTEQPEPMREAECQRRIQDEANQPFDLQANSQLRAQLLRLKQEEHVLLVTLHHIITDGWSMEIFWRELSTFYAAAINDQMVDLRPLPIQYADFAVWQRQWLQGEVLAQQVGYWKNQLADLTQLALLTDVPRPTQQTYRGAKLTFTLTSTVVQKLLAISQREKITLFMTLLATYQALLARYTGLEDIAVGTVITNRPKTELEDLIGFFVNTLVLRSRVTGSLSFQQLLHQVKETCLQAYAYQDLPFEKLVEVLQPVRDPSRHPLVQTMFHVSYGHEVLPLTLSNLDVTAIPSKCEAAKFDLTVAFTIRGETMTGQLVYNSDLFTHTTMEQFERHFQRMLLEVMSDPSQRLSDILLLDDREREQQLNDWNNLSTPILNKQNLPQLFEAQVARTPDAIAVVYEAEQLTYTQLNQRANQLAHYLQQQSVGLEVRVGVCLERDLDLIVSLLAILKAGGVYVPLDPSYPPERLTYMLTDAKAMVVLTSEAIHEKLGPYSGHVLTLEWTTLLDESSENLPSWTAPANLVYVLYTSGSTGRPKGVMIAEASAVAFLHWAKSVFSYEDLAGVLAATSICFDLSVFELFVPLSWGGTVVLAENALQLPEILEIDRVTLINTVPSVIGALLDKVLPPSVRTVNLAGEPLKTEMVKAIDRAWGVAAVYDLYGPSETTTYATYAVRSQMGPATIGRALGTTTVFLLDQYGQLVPVGVPGELTIGGVQVARGYLHRPALTAEKFGPNSFNATPGTVVYQTGDRARYLADGTLEFLGRIDHQIKLRGYRIELGEIEALLSQHAAVQEAVVLCREDSSLAEKYLVAYVTKTQDKLEVPELRAYLQKRLPNYMIPATFVTIEQFPLTPNGKIDRKALPGHTAEDRTQVVTYVAPHTLLEELVAEVWQQVLNIERIGIHDNFFELGGHSLLATRVIARLRQVLELSAPLRTIFEHPTIAEFAMAIDSQLDATCPDSSRDESIG